MKSLTKLKSNSFTIFKLSTVQYLKKVKNETIGTNNRPIMSHRSTFCSISVNKKKIEVECNNFYFVLFAYYY